MQVSNTVFILIAMVHALGSVIPSACASEIKRKLDHHMKKDSKKSKAHYDPIEEGILNPFLSMSLDLHSMSFDMSYPYPKGSKSGKGKGKGSGDIISKGKGSKKGSGSSKGSKKASKSGKKGTGKGMGKGHDTTHPDHPPAPTPTSSSVDDNSRPPSPIPPERPPTSSPGDIPGSTPAPTAPGAALQEVILPKYAIEYVLSESVMPMREDYLQVEEVTNTYFSDYMLQVFAEPTDNSLLEFTTTLVTSEFRFDEPVTITYESIAYFAEDFPASSLPSPETLEFLLQQSLEDPADYIDLLASLGEENAFSATVSVNFSAPTVNATSSDDDSSDTTTTRSSNPGTSPVVIAAGAVGAALLVFGVVAYRRRMAENDDDDNLIKKGSKAHGGATVAGETYSGETYDGATSVSPSSQSSPDEEHALINIDLDEAESTIDNISVSPAWEGSVSGTINHYESHEDDDCDGNNAGGQQTSKPRSYNQSSNPNTENSSFDDPLNAHGFSSGHDHNGGDHSQALSETGNEGRSATQRSVENFDVILGVTSDMSMTSHDDDEEIQSIQSARRPLSVAEIESMLNTSFLM